MANWDDYRFLLALDTYGSLASAARALKVSHPTVSRRVGELETTLSVKLVERGADGARLTRTGQRVANEARRLERLARAIELNAAEAEKPERRRISVTASEGLAAAVLTPLLAGLREVLPDVSIDMTVGTRPANMRLGEADVAVRMGDPVDDGLVGRRIAVARFGLYGHESYLARAGVPETVADLARHDIVESTEAIAGVLQAKWLRRAAKGARVVGSSNSILNQVSALRAGLGLVALPTYLAADVPGVRRLMREVFDPELDIWALRDPDTRDRAEIGALIDYLAKRVPERLTLMAG